MTAGGMDSFAFRVDRLDAALTFGERSQGGLCAVS